MKKGRQTLLSLEQLRVELNDPRSLYPKCLLINEIGGLCLDGNKEAETILVQQLETADEPELKVAALCYLFTTPTLNISNFAKLSVFEKNPENKEMVALARKMVSKKE